MDALASKVERLEIKDREKEMAINELCEENILRIRLEKMEQYSRCNNLIVSGIPQRENEKVREVIPELAKQWNIKIPANGIMAAHRLYAKTGTPDIIVKMVDRDNVWTNDEKVQNK